MSDLNEINFLSELGEPYFFCSSEPTFVKKKDAVSFLDRWGYDKWEFNSFSIKDVLNFTWLIGLYSKKWYIVSGHWYIVDKKGAFARYPIVARTKKIEEVEDLLNDYVNIFPNRTLYKTPKEGKISDMLVNAATLFSQVEKEFEQRAMKKINEKIVDKK